MPSHRAALPVLFSALVFASLAEARQAPQPRGAVPVERQTIVTAPQTTLTVVAEDQDARETRDRFRALLERYPPALARVLKLDPSLLNNPGYLATYPGLAAFLAQHPEVARNPGYFLAHVSVGGDHWPPQTPQSQAMDLWRNMIEGITMFFVFLVVTGTLAWLIKTLLDYRRWSRVSRVQAEVHTKLLDRFAGNEDLLAYIQTPAGRRFLESAPIPLDAAPRGFSAPLGRILLSFQAGLVLVAAAWVSNS